MRIRMQRSQTSRNSFMTPNITIFPSKKATLCFLVYKPIRKNRKVRQTTPSLDWPFNYEVKLQQGRHKSDIVHVVAMKPFHEREPNTNNLSSLSSSPVVISRPISPVEEPISDRQQDTQLPFSDTFFPLVSTTVYVNQKGTVSCTKNRK